MKDKIETYTIGKDTYVMVNGKKFKMKESVMVCCCKCKNLMDDCICDEKIYKDINGYSITEKQYRSDNYLKYGAKVRKNRKKKYRAYKKIKNEMNFETMKEFTKWQKQREEELEKIINKKKNDKCCGNKKNNKCCNE